MTSRSYQLSDLPEVAKALLEAFGRQAVFALIGDLGAGKTTLVAEMCRQLGVAEPTSSPTFSIVNQYKGADGPVYHLDCYRLENTEEALNAGLEELFEGEGYPIFVEWPAVIEPLLPPGVVFLQLRHASEGESRSLTISTGHPPNNE
ncbi:tRNA (adenosine(37)-N6)-threonylcarbamoyltransferase complex ATPase subunit type 1 TsaE [Neolewinella agarilytica]|uniref:tRNA threonylcarbamoyladenosine biosynthesis protein TsaE n=1 Tax=Neolewinella agarilytica TaxID=478744 RepID=A0A1H9GFE5_9BACT|nr:tRNA (adenosine(37)-N6)-threonylcarbamoyltransferase complex ATPase subunit type 1 TsaE [Neolewinella agarilytica]SEQ48548.1 tRNA threonylcarbamoyladenosine biosynthesis protein TsaE [Neolewinella agarilytica]